MPVQTEKVIERIHDSKTESAMKMSQFDDT